MAALSFPQFLRRYGIKLLVTSTPDIVPGAVIERRKKGYFKYGHLQAILGGDDASWACRLQPANFVYGTIERTLSLKAKASLSEFGVSIGGGRPSPQAQTNLRVGTAMPAGSGEASVANSWAASTTTMRRHCAPGRCGACCRSTGMRWPVCQRWRFFCTASSGRWRWCWRC